jgi:hypothetical protein
MNDIFISYAREDRERVAPLAQALAAQGWLVWWDPEIPFGKRFGQAIEEALTTARCVIVVWSNRSVRSHWVIDEASYGRDHDILVPVLIDRVSPPLGFRQIQTAELIEWNGRTTFPEFKKLLKNISSIIELSSSGNDISLESSRSVKDKAPRGFEETNDQSPIRNSGDYILPPNARAAIWAFLIFAMIPFFTGIISFFIGGF